jgi:hypothetical protein
MHDATPSTLFTERTSPRFPVDYSVRPTKIGKWFNTRPDRQSYVATVWGICGLLVLGALLTALLIKPWNAAHEKVLRRDEA